MRSAEPLSQWPSTGCAAVGGARRIRLVHAHPSGRSTEKTPSVPSSDRACLASGRSLARLPSRIRPAGRRLIFRNSNASAGAVLGRIPVTHSSPERTDRGLTRRAMTTRRMPRPRRRRRSRANPSRRLASSRSKAPDRMEGSLSSGRMPWLWRFCDGGANAVWDSVSSVILS